MKNGLVKSLVVGSMSFASLNGNAQDRGSTNEDQSLRSESVSYLDGFRSDEAVFSFATIERCGFSCGLSCGLTSL
jgi:hypothetical protein